MAGWRSTGSVPGGIVINKLTHASPAWWGFASADDRNRLDAFLRKSAKLGYHSTTFASICDDADCKLFTRITGNTQHLLYPLLPLNASITTLSLFVNAVTTFNYLIAHLLLETEIILWEHCIVMLFIANSIFSSYSSCNSVLSVILLKLKYCIVMMLAIRVHKDHKCIMVELHPCSHVQWGVHRAWGCHGRRST